MQRVIQLTEEEYIDLTEKKNDVNVFLKQRCEELEDEVTRLKKFEIFSREQEIESNRLGALVTESTIPELFDKYSLTTTGKTKIYDRIAKEIGKSRSYVYGKLKESKKEL